MLGRSCVMTRNGVNFLLLKPKVVLKRGSVMRVHNLQPLTQPKPPLVKTRKEPFIHRVLRPLRAMVRRRWHQTGRTGSRCLSIKVCGTLICKIWL